MDHMQPARNGAHRARGIVRLAGMFFSACTLFLPVAAPGQEVASVYSLSLEELGQLKVQSASKQLEPAVLAPGTVYDIRRDEIERYGFRTLQDALKFVPSVYLYDPHSWVWGGQRGLVSNFSQTLLLVNGREVNNLIALEGFISRQFATHNVERIEVVAGPSSALYGANALAGVINVISRQYDPAFSGVDVEAEVGSFDRRSIAATFGKQFGARTRFSGSLRAFASDEEDYSGFINDQDDFLRGWADAPLAAPYLTDYDNPSKAATWEAQLDHGDFYIGTFGYYNRQSHGLEKLTWTYDDNEDHRRFELYYAGMDRQFSDAFKVKAEYQFIRSLLWGKYFQGLWPARGFQAPADTEIFAFPDQVTTSTGVTLQGEAAYRAFYPSFAHYLVDQGLLDPDNVTPRDIRRHFAHLYTNRSTEGSHRHRADLQVDWTPDAISSLIAGISLDYIDFAGLAVTDAAPGAGAFYDIPLDDALRLDVYDSKKYGAFVQYKREFARWHLWMTAGLRVDHQNHYGTTVNPRASVVWQPVPGSILEFAYAQAFREPNVFELASDPDIDPARMKSYEISLNQLIANLATLQVAVYQNDVEDFLGSVSSLIGAGVGSVDSQTVRGLEFQLEGGKGPWRYVFSGSHIFDAEQDVAGPGGAMSTRAVLGIPKTRFNLALTRQFGRWDASLLYRHVHSHRALGGNVSVTQPFRIPSADIVDLVVNSPAVPFQGGEWRASLGINNLADERYFDANIRRSGPHQFLQDGRSVVFSVNAGY